MPEPHIFLDTSALVAAVLSETGGARALLRLSELDAIVVTVGPRVLSEAEEVFRRKAPHLLPSLALLLAQANVRTGPAASDVSLVEAAACISYQPDALILAEALEAKVAFLATHDQTHFTTNPQIRGLPCLVGSPGDALAWVREQLMREG